MGTLLSVHPNTLIAPFDRSPTYESAVLFKSRGGQSALGKADITALKLWQDMCRERRGAERNVWTQG